MTTGRPGASRSTKTPSPFLSRLSAAQAASRSDRDGLGSQDLFDHGRFETREAQRCKEPEGDRLPCLTVYPEAVSSACANVWPRFRIVRPPLARTDPRQIPALYAAHRGSSPPLRAPRVDGPPEAPSSPPRPSLAALSRRKSGEQVWIDDDRLRDSESADEILSRRQCRRPSCRRSRRPPARAASSALRVQLTPAEIGRGREAGDVRRRTAAVAEIAPLVRGRSPSRTARRRRASWRPHRGEASAPPSTGERMQLEARIRPRSPRRAGHGPASLARSRSRRGEQHIVGRSPGTARGPVDGLPRRRRAPERVLVPRKRTVRRRTRSQAAVEVDLDQDRVRVGGESLRVAPRALLRRRARSRQAARREASATTSSSRRRNSGSPLEELGDRAHAALDLPSVSTKGRAVPRGFVAPTVDFPAPMKPMRARCLPSAPTWGSAPRRPATR